MCLDVHMRSQTVLVAVCLATDGTRDRTGYTARVVVARHVHVQAVLVFHVAIAEGATEAVAPPPESCNSRL